ncbi:MAG: hypothetical protein ACLUHE_15165 [Christensenellales bacterium]
MADGIGQRQQCVVVKPFARLVSIRIDLPTGISATASAGTGVAPSLT